jgi:hypothetical protein
MMSRSWTQHRVAKYEWKDGVVRPPSAEEEGEPEESTTSSSDGGVDGAVPPTSKAAAGKTSAPSRASSPSPPLSKNVAMFPRGDVTLAPNEGTSLLILPIDVLLFHADYLQPGRVPVVMQFNLLLERVWSDVASKVRNVSSSLSFFFVTIYSWGLFFIDPFDDVCYQYLLFQYFQEFSQPFLQPLASALSLEERTELEEVRF